MEAFVCVSTKTGQVGTPRLELGKGIKFLVIGEVVVGIELLAVTNPMIEAQRELVGIVVAIGNCLEKCETAGRIRDVRVRHILLQKSQ